MRQIITFILIFISINLIAQDKFVAHDYINGNIPSYKPTFQESFPKWAKLLYENEANFYDIQQSYNHWKLDNSKKEFKAVERYYKIWSRHVIPYVSEDGSIIIPNHSTDVESQNMPNIVSDNNWEFLGPKETFFLNETGGEIAMASCPWQVNVYSFDVSKSNNNVLYCGTETGFVNKSIDNGDSWKM